MLRRDRNYGVQLAKRSLIDAFRVVEDAELVSATRRRMASLLF
jgi:putative thioredoxin